MEIRIPEVGESIAEAVVARWHVEEGERVTEGQLLCELETDKINLELNAEAGGILSIAAGEGKTIPVGGLLGTIEEAQGEQAEEEFEEASPEKEAGRRAAEEEKEAPPLEEPLAARPMEAEAPQQEERAPKRTERAPQEARVTRVAMTPIRRRIAERLLEARQRTAMLTSFNEADMSRVVDLRQGHREDFLRRHGVGLGFMSFFVKACVAALQEFPDVNARIEGDDIVYQHFYDIGIAIGTPRGLIVPILRDADKLGFAEIEKKIADFSDRAQKGRIDLFEIEGGTFSITNGGVYGSLLSTPILNPPQAAILGMHAIQDRPVAREGEVVIRPMMNLALSYDHRLIDGRGAVQFLKRIKGYIDTPEEMLLEF